MLLMGLRESVYWGGWLITYAVIAATTSVVIVSSPLTAAYLLPSLSALYSCALSVAPIHALISPCPCS